MTGPKTSAAAQMQEDVGPDLPQVPGGWATRELEIFGRAFTLHLPADPDRFLDEPEVIAAHERDEYMPYWPYLWPASIAMAEAILRAKWTAGTRALEIGCGIGLAGLAGLAAGLDVTFSDYDRVTVGLAVHNARLNGFGAARGMWLDWREPPADRYPIILGCDVVYEVRNHEPILNLLDAMLDEGGVCWLGDYGRAHAETFIDSARRRSFAVELQSERGETRTEPVSGRFQLIVLRRR